MLSQTLRRSLLETKSALPSTYTLPIRSITTISHTLEPNNVSEPLIQSAHRIPKDAQSKSRTPKREPNATTAPSKPTPPHPTSQPPKPLPNAHNSTTPITEEVKKTLPLLKAQPPYYITAHINGHPYLLTSGDTLRLPYLLPDVLPGDTIRLNRATHLGSRDYTLKAPEPMRAAKEDRIAGAVDKTVYLDDRLFVCRATVVGVETEPMRVMEKTVRRRRHVRHVRSKHRFTVLRVGEIKVRGVEEVERLQAGIEEAGAEA